MHYAFLNLHEVNSSSHGSLVSTYIRLQNRIDFGLAILELWVVSRRFGHLETTYQSLHNAIYKPSPQLPTAVFCVKWTKRHWA